MDLDGFCNARVVAVVGASADGYFSLRLRENLEAGDRDVHVYPVNPAKKRLWGRRAYPDLRSLPSRPDLVFVLLGARDALAAVRSMAGLGLGRAIVLAEGFSKADTRRLVSAAGGMEILGPESLGIMDVPRSTLFFCGRLTFAPPAGHVSIVSRSGGLMVECLRTLRNEPRWGVRRAVCCGSEAVLGASQVLAALSRDEGTETVILCLERDPAVASLAPGLMALAEAGKETIIFSTAMVGLRDPEVLVEGRGGAVLEANAVEALARHAGAFLASNMDEVAEAAAFVSSRPAARGRGGGSFLVSVSAGVGEWMAGAARRAGLEVAPVGRGLRSRLPGGTRASNPIDLSASGVTEPGVLEAVVAACAADRTASSVIVAMHPPAGSSFSDRRNAAWLEFLRGHDGTGPLVMGVQPTAATADPVPGLQRGLDGALRIARWWLDGRPGGPGLEPPADRSDALRILHGPPRTLSEPSSRRLLSTYGLPFDEWHLAETPSQAATRVRSMGTACCLRLASPDMSASAPGCTRAPVRGDAAAREAFMEITQAGRERGDHRILGVLVTRHRAAERALFAATLSPDGDGPPLLVTGTGGRARGIARSYVPALCPLTPASAHRIAGEALALAGIEGDVPSLADLLARLCRFAHDFLHEVALVDIETIVPARGGWRCLDARVRIRRRVEGL